MAYYKSSIHLHVYNNYAWPHAHVWMTPTPVFIKAMSTKHQQCQMYDQNLPGSSSPYVLFIIELLHINFRVRRKRAWFEASGQDLSVTWHHVDINELKKLTVKGTALFVWQDRVPISFNKMQRGQQDNIRLPHRLSVANGNNTTGDVSVETSQLLLWTRNDETFSFLTTSLGKNLSCQCFD